MDLEDGFKYCDDLSILELLMIGKILTNYDFMNHVASYIGIDQKYLPTELLQTHPKIDLLALRTKENLMKLNEVKTKYLIFHRPQQ